jgi:predicted secreted protein
MPNYSPPLFFRILSPLYQFSIIALLTVATLGSVQAAMPAKQSALPVPPPVAAVPWQVSNQASAGKNVANPATAKPTLADLLPELINADTVPKVLAKFTPPVSEAQIVNSDYLGLNAPQIALAGLVTVRLLSELPGTDLFLLFNANPRVNEPSLLSASVVPALTKAESRVQVKLTDTTNLLLIARANGLWYKVSSEVKIAQKVKK